MLSKVIRKSLCRSSHRQLVSKIAVASIVNNNLPTSIAPVRSISSLTPTLVVPNHLRPQFNRRWFSTAGELETINVPAMGDSISEGTVVEWLKNPGDAVEIDEVVVVLETDKVSIDVRAPFAGVLVERLAEVDDTVNVGAALVSIQPGTASTTTSPPTEQATEGVVEKATTIETAKEENEKVINVPSMGDSISEGTIVQWVKTVGDSVDTDEVVVVLETDKVSVDVRAPSPGRITQTLADLDAVVTIDQPLFAIQPGQSPPPSSKQEQKTPSPAVSTPQEAVPSSPSAVPSTPAHTPTPTPSPVVGTNNNRTQHREKMSRMRLRIAERLKESQNTNASLTTFQEVDMSALINFRKEYKDSFLEKHDVKLGFMSAFMKASSAALLEVPSVNATIEKDEIVFRDYVDMSVAVSTPKGLVTPVVHNVESMSFADIEKKLASLAAKGRDGTLSLDEMTGGNFTISNGGVFGSLMGTPIINLPQSAILGMHATKMRPVVTKEGEIVAKPMMYLALTYDHRLIDGREAVTCLKSIADKIEDPKRLLLEL